LESGFRLAPVADFLPLVERDDSDHHNDTDNQKAKLELAHRIIANIDNI
jgi:hypothetical protein